MRLPRLGRSRRLLAAALLLLAAAPAHAALMLAEPPYRPKDFTVVKKDGRFHIFYIRHDITKASPLTERDFGHAVSADMYTWSQLPGVIPVRDTNWDNLHVWAPSIVELDGVYYMFYTGVTERPGAPGVEQRTGLATSTDLMSWNRLDDPIYSCRDVPWAWCDTTNNNNGFRDPFVMPDPAVPGRWLMYYTTFASVDLTGMVVGLAASDGDLTQWHDQFPLWFTNQIYSYSTIIESPHLFKHGNLWFMFVTVNAGQPISYYTTTNPTGPPGDWANLRRLSTMIGYDTGSWYASEYFADGLNDYFAFVNYNRIEMYKMAWTGPETFQLFEPGNFHIQSLNWSADTLEEGQNATLSVVATGWANHSVSLTAAERLPGGGEAAFPIDSLGIPSQLPLTSDTTLFEWPARIFHAAGDTIGTESVVLRVFDLTAEAKPITILPPPPPPPPLEVRGLSWSADSVVSGHPVTLRVAAVHWSGHTLALQGVERLAVGGEAAVVLDSLGLPSAVPLTADTTLVAWCARIRRPSGDTTSALDLELRTTDPAAVAPLLRVLPRPPRPFSVDRLQWSSSLASSGETVTLSIVASGWNGHEATLAAAERQSAMTDSVIAVGDLGLPATVPLVADTTCLQWSARIRRASGDTTGTQVLIVSAAGGPAAAPLTVALPAVTSGETEDGVPVDKLPRIRRLNRSVYGELPSFVVDLPRPAHVRLDVFDLMGRRVRTVADRDLPVGATVIAWDGRNAGGAPMSRGLYFARFVTPSFARTIKVVLTRPAGSP